VYTQAKCTKERLVLKVGFERWTAGRMMDSNTTTSKAFDFEQL